MITTLDELPESSQVDVCIVGAGAAGLSLALELEHACSSLLVLEAGGPLATKHDPSLRADVTGFGAASFADSRARGLGGTTTLWAGQALPLEPVDFQRRAWVADSGWPISVEDVREHLPRAQRMLGVPPVTYDTATWPRDQLRPPDLAAFELEFRFSQFTPEPDFARRHHTSLSASRTVTVALAAAVDAVELDAGGTRVSGLTVTCTNTGARRTVCARRYVLCCGGVESCRLMLASLARHDGALTFERDLVGRGYGDHAHVGLALKPGRSQTRRAFNTRLVEGRRIMPKLVASPAWQAAHQALSIGADIAYSAPERSPIAAGKHLVSAARGRSTAGVPRAAADVAVHLPQLVSAGYGRARHGHKLSEGVGAPVIGLQCETAPSHGSRVKLLADGLGVAVHWWVGTQERETMRAFAAQLARALPAAGLGTIDAQLPATDDDEGWKLRVSAGHHHVGGLRMGRDPQTSVVDRDLRVHGVENLFVASCAVFPTGGFSNPTLSLLALTARLADRLGEDRGG